MMNATRNPVLVGMLVVLLVANGCGCCSDLVSTVIPDTGPDRIAQAQLGIALEPVVIEPPDGPVKVDVMFLLDDGLSMTEVDPFNSGPAYIPGDVSPKRLKTDVAQQIFQSAMANLESRLETDGVGTKDEIDLAFGVSRYEDYAGFQRGDGRSPVDTLARPFILNQPILRQYAFGNTTAFQSFFQDQLALRGTATDPNPNPAGGTPGDGGSDQPSDPQSAIEALYQLATGVGFDGNLNGSTDESGAAGLWDTMFYPGDSGDVPAFAATDNQTDATGHPNYLVGDQEASGTIGGAGWRPDSIRFIILVSDKGTVAPLVNADPLSLVDGKIQGQISNAGPIAGTPLLAETVENVQAFAIVNGLPPAQTTQAVHRYGWDDDIDVAPENAATLQSTITALNEMGIEVFSIGIGDETGPSPVKPNLPPEDGQTDVPAGEYPAITDPQAPPSQFLPYTWMSAVAILTGARDPNVDGEDNPNDRWEPDLPLVYKIDTLSPQGESINPDLQADLSDRIAIWKPYKASGGTIPPSGVVGWVYYDVEIDASQQNPDVRVDSIVPLQPEPSGDPEGYYVSKDGTKQVVRVPVYYAGNVPVPTPEVRVAWLVQSTNTQPQATEELFSTLTVNITPQASATAPDGGANPTDAAEGQTAPFVSQTAGLVATTLPEIVDPEDAAPDGASQVTVATGGGLYFRDFSRGLPSGISIDTMAGPFPPQLLPYPANP